MKIRQDQARPHAFAFERVGFILARSAAILDGLLVLPFDYFPVADENYLEDHTVGARINSDAIRDALQLSFTYSAGLFHVHPHPHYGMPSFSSIDRRSLAELVPSFFNATPQSLHGAIVCSDDSIAGAVWESKYANPVQISQITVVGSPRLVFGGAYVSPAAL